MIKLASRWLVRFMTIAATYAEQRTRRLPIKVGGIIYSCWERQLGQSAGTYVPLGRESTMVDIVCELI